MNLSKQEQTMDEHLEKCISEQEKLAKKIILKSNFTTSDIKLVSGIDLAYWQKDNKEYAVCCINVIDYMTHEVIENVHKVGVIEFPYIAGCLAFRELPLILETNKLLKNKPDIYIFDGNGYLHPRHMGIATHASIYLDKPSIGIAKSYYKINGVDFDMPDNYAGAFEDIVINGKVYGRTVRTHKDVRPIFLSTGNYIDLDTAQEIMESLVKNESHIPIPTRLADLETHRMRMIYRGEEQNAN